MATIDKTKSKTYNFLSENKSIKDIKQQANIEVIEKRRHGGITYKLIENNNVNNQLVNDSISENETQENFEPVANNLTNDEKEKEINNDIWTKFKNYLNWSTSNTEEISKLKSIIKEKDKEIEQLKNQIEELNKPKQGNINFDDFKYNAITIYDEKQSKKTGIDKIYEEILPIEDKIIFITTFVHIDNSITEEIIHFQQLTNSDIKVFKQNKHYLNINEYKKDFILCENQLNNKSNVNIEIITIKDFLKKQQDFKLKPTKTDWKIWGTFTTLAIIPIICAFLPFVWPVVSLVFIDKIVISAFLVTIGIGSKIFSSIFSPITKKVESLISNKITKNKEAKEKSKKERQSIIKNLTSDKPETKLETQFKILKQELDNRKDKNPDQLMTNNTINHNSNSLLDNNNNFDSSIRNTVNQSNETSTSSINNWNKVKGLLTT